MTTTNTQPASVEAEDAAWSLWREPIQTQGTVHERAAFHAGYVAALASQAPAEKPPEQEVQRFWLELREPRCVPERKGPFPMAGFVATLREFMAARPTAYITVVTLGYDGPDFQDAPEALQMADGRSMGTGRKHIQRTREAHALATPGSATGREAAAPTSGWQPIETAPKDQNEIWAWPCQFEDGPAVVKAYWYVHPSVQGWITDELDCNDYDFRPTHWQPGSLPKPAAPASPEAAGQGGE